MSKNKYDVKFEKKSPDFEDYQEGGEQEILESVTKEIKQIGAMTKENIESINKNFHELKHELDNQKEKVDVLAKMKIDKLVTDISKRQEEVDAEFQKQNEANANLQKNLEKLDVAIQRNKFTGSGGGEELKEAKQLLLEVSAIKNGQVKFHQIQEEAEKMASQYPEYKNAFEAFLRQPGDEHKLDPDNFKALSVGSDPDGGFSVTPQMSNRIVEKLYETSPLRALAAVESISTDALEMMVDKDDTTSCGWESETIAGGETDTPKIAKLRIPVHMMYAKVRATQQLLEDSAINIENWLSIKVGEKMGRKEAEAFIKGDGVGKPKGFLQYSHGTNWGQIEQIATGNASTITADFFVDMKYALIEQFLNRGTWLMNRQIVALAMKLKTSGGGDYVWKPSMLANDPTSSILGLPLRMASDMPAKADNALAVALADWREAYQIVDRLGVSVQRDPYTAKPLVEFYFRKRMGGDVVNFQAIKIGKIAASV